MKNKNTISAQKINLCDLPESEFEMGGVFDGICRIAGYASGKAAANELNLWGVTVSDAVKTITSEAGEHTKEKVTGFKGFNKDLQCRGFQFEVGKTFKHEGELKLCAEGFHFCEHPLNVFDYYAPSESRFAEVEGIEVSPETKSDTKRVCKSLEIKAELDFSALVSAAVKFVFSKADWSKKEQHATGSQGAASATGSQRAASATGSQGAASATGMRGAASATGDQGAASATGSQGAASATGMRGAASATGYQGAASATGMRGAASATGDQGAAVSLGIESKAKGEIGCWITVSEWKLIKNEWQRIDVKTVKVGKRIKPNTYYQLKNGKFVEEKQA